MGLEIKGEPLLDYARRFRSTSTKEGPTLATKSDNPKVHLIVDFNSSPGRTGGFHLNSDLSFISHLPKKHTVNIHTEGKISSEKIAKLQPRTNALLDILTMYAGITLPQDFLIEKVWEDDVVVKNNLYQHVKALRRNIEVDPENPKIIHTNINGGVRFGDLDLTKHFDRNSKKVVKSAQIELEVGTYFPDHGVVSKYDGDIKLTPGENSLLDTLCKDMGTIYTRAELAAISMLGLNSIPVYISWLRGKLGQELIKRRAGGYFIDPVPQSDS